MEKMGKRFDGKVALITASTQGIGFGIAERLGLEGAAVVISSRRQKNVDEGVEKLKGIGIEVLGLVCHVSNAQQRKDLIKKTIEKFGKIDVIVCNAAANPAVDGILETKESVLDKLWEINVKTSILLLQEAAPHLDKGSSVVFVSSIAAFQPSQGLAMYGVTKTALLGLTKEKKAFCKECAKNGNMALFHPSVNDAVTAMISSRLGQLEWNDIVLPFFAHSSQKAFFSFVHWRGSEICSIDVMGCCINVFLFQE